MIGIDIQPQSICLIQLKRKKQNWVIDWAKISPLSSFPESNQAWQQIETHLQQFIPPGKYKSAAIALSAHLVHMQTISLPTGLTDDEIKKEIESYLERDCPSPKNTLCIDFNSRKSFKTGYTDIFFAAVKKEVLIQYTHCLERAGLSIQLVDVDLLAINRMIVLLIPNLLQKKYLALYCTDTRSILFAIHHEDLIFHQSLPLTDYSEFYNQLNNQVQFYLNSHSKAHATQIIICSHHLYAKKAIQEISAKYDLDFYYLHLSPSNLLNDEKITAITSKPLDFLLALSLAMQGEKYD